MIRKINLKKQLAFISSLALIAGTAVYMPADVCEFFGTAVSVNADDSDEMKKPALKINGDDCLWSDWILKNSTAENSISNPYILLAECADSDGDMGYTAYGDKYDYEFIPDNGMTSVSGLKGTITFGDVKNRTIVFGSFKQNIDVLAETDIYKASVNGVETYYKVYFINEIYSFMHKTNGNVYFDGLSGTYSDGSKYEKIDSHDDGRAAEAICDGKTEVVDGNYVKNYTITIPQKIKANSTISVNMQMPDGYEVNENGTTFDITLNENGTASKIVKISSSQAGLNKVEYIKFNIRLSDLDMGLMDTYMKINGRTDYTASYITYGDNYAKVYTIRDVIPENREAKVENGGYYKFILADDSETDTLTINDDGNTDIVRVLIGDMIYYTRIAYNPTYNLEFYDEDELIATHEETIGEKYILPENPTKEGYVFAGWYTEDDIQLDSETIAENSHGTKVYAKWTEQVSTVKYNLSISPNYGNKNSISINNITYDSDCIINVSDYADLTRSGYELLGFATRNYVVTPEYKINNGTVTIRNATDKDGATVKLYAVWKAKAGFPSIKLEGKDIYEISNPVLKDENAANSASNPYVLSVKTHNAVYGSTLKYEFVPADGTASISGSKGTVTFDSDNGSAETGIYRVSIDGVETYYQAEFYQPAYIFVDLAGSTGLFFKGSYVSNIDDAEKSFYGFNLEYNLKLINGNYAKNYNVAVPADVKVKSKITVSLSGFANGYGTGLADDKFDITLDENGKASKLVRISSAWDGKDIVEYFNFNFYLESDFDKSYSLEFEDMDTYLNYTKDSYTESYIIEDNKYVKVYTIRGAAETKDFMVQANNWGISTEDRYCFRDGAEGQSVQTRFKVTDGVSDAMEVVKAGSNYNFKQSTNQYMKVVFDPAYTLTFYDSDKITVLATQEETIGGTYVLPENPAKEGYTFAGWKLENGKTILKNQPVEQSDSLKAYAQWSPIRYTVKLDANGGTAATSALGDWSISSYGTSVQKTDVAYDTADKLTAGTGIVKKDGYELIGFSTDKNAKTPDKNLSFLNEKDEINADAAITFDKLTSKSGSTVTLYAVWRAESKTLKFDTENIIVSMNGNVGQVTATGLTIENDSKLSEMKFTIDSEIGELPAAILRGFTFKGWYYATGDGEEVVVMITPDTILTSELAEETIYPYFENNVYTVTYEDITFTDEKAPSKLIFDFDTINNQFMFCNDDYEKSGTSGYINEEKAGYKLLGYTVNGIAKDAAQKEETESKYFSLSEIEKFLTSNYTEKSVTFVSTPLTYKTSDGKTATLSVGTENITIKAVWAVDDTKSILNIDYDDAVISYKNSKGTTVSVKPTSSTYSKFPSTIIGTPDNRITYDCDIDGAGTDNITFTDYGFDVDDVECTLSKDGYVFKGWFFKDSDGKEKAFTNTKFTAGVTNIYAKWEAESKLTAPADVKVSKDGVVSWTKSEGAAYYRVYKVYNGITKNAKTTSSSYTFQNLAKGVEHEIYVIAFDANGNSIRSESIKFTPMSAPTDVKVSEDGVVSWTKSEGAAYYRVYKVYNGITKNAKTTSSPYTFQNLAKGVEHEIYVIAFDKDGNQYKSESVKFTPMSAPTDVKVSEDGVVSWTKSEGAAYYRVYKVYNGITKNAKTTSSPYTFQNLAEGVEHEIYVIAFDKNGSQYKSESVKFTPAKKAVLTAPTNVKVDADGNVTWTAAENAAYYKVSKVVNGKTSTGKQVTDTKYTFINFNPGQNKTVYVTAFDKDGNSVKSEAVTVRAVENLKVTAKGTVTFNKVDGASYYRVYKVYNGVTKNAKTTVSPYTFQSFTKGVKHDVYVKAYDSKGNEIAVSKTVTVTAK